MIHKGEWKYEETICSDGRCVRRNKNIVTVADIDSGGAFVADVPTSHPQRIMMEYGKNYAWEFIMPGDTLECTTTASQKITRADIVPAYSLYVDE